jgi:5-methylcytosine-specific restriction endonuclease McrA
MLRDPKFDRPKGLAQIQKDMGKVCKACGEPVSNFEGPGSDVLCRHHQINQREYGGMGRLDRPHTFHRKHTCDICGKDVAEEVRKKFPGLEESNPKLFNRLVRNRVIGDHHGDRKADGGSDYAENVRSLCLDCNSDETILKEDYRPSKKSKLVKKS